MWLFFPALPRFRTYCLDTLIQNWQYTLGTQAFLALDGANPRSLAMKTGLKAALLLALVIGVGEPARADAADRDGSPSPDKKAPEVAKGDAFVSVLTQPTGGPILAVKYPWKRHVRASVEVRVLDPSEVDNPLIRPLFFLHDLMKGNVTTAVYRCQDDSEDVAQTAVFSKDALDFEIFGARNALGRPAVCVACRTATTRHPADTSGEPGDLAAKAIALLGPALEREPETWAAFPLLLAWALDERTLYLQLPAEYFSRPCKIRVWLLRGKDVVWVATTDWPGYPGAIGTREPAAPGTAESEAPGAPE
jgi:hypothetical protein